MFVLQPKSPKAVCLVLNILQNPPALDADEGERGAAGTAAAHRVPGPATSLLAGVSRSQREQTGGRSDAGAAPEGVFGSPADFRTAGGSTFRPSGRTLKPGRLVRDEKDSRSRFPCTRSSNWP